MFGRLWVGGHRLYIGYAACSITRIYSKINPHFRIFSRIHPIHRKICHHAHGRHVISSTRSVARTIGANGRSHPTNTVGRVALRFRPIHCGATVSLHAVSRCLGVLPYGATVSGVSVSRCISMTLLFYYMEGQVLLEELWQDWAGSRKVDALCSVRKQYQDHGGLDHNPFVSWFF
jgi:hypothetical protein